MTDRREMATPRQIALPAVLTIFGLLIIALTPLQVSTVSSDDVGPRAVPYVTGIAIALGGAAELLSRIVRHRRGLGVTPNSSDVSEQSSAPSWWSYVAVVVGILVWVYATAWVGYAVSSTVLVVLTALAFGLRKPLSVVILTLVSVAVTYVVFAELLAVQLPLMGR